VLTADDFGRFWSNSGSDRRMLEMTWMTHHVNLLRDFGATQHVQRAAIPTYKCSISYSITSSARASSDGGTVRPSAFAVLRLIANSYLVGACTGRSAAFSPLRMRSM
jgi:hypothetical protein